METPFFPFMLPARHTIQTKDPCKGQILFIKETTYSCATGDLTVSSSTLHGFMEKACSRCVLLEQGVRHLALVPDPLFFFRSLT